MSEIKTRILEREEYPLWDEIVQQSPQGTLFHTTPWLLLAERHSKTKLILIIGTIGEKVIAGLPFFYRNRGIFRKIYSPVGSSMIHTLGPIYPEYLELKQYKREHYLRNFHSELHQYVYSELRPDTYSVITSPPSRDIRPFLWDGYNVSPRYNFIIDIRDPEMIWSNFKRELRKSIKKTEDFGVVIEEGGKEDYINIISSVTKKIDNEESFPKKELINDLFQVFWPENFKIFIAKYNEETVGGIIALAFNNRLSAWYGGMKYDLQGVYPTDLLIWRSMEWGKSHDFQYFENFGANIPAISYFKSRYNFDLNLYFHISRKSKLLQLHELFKS